MRLDLLILFLMSFTVLAFSITLNIYVLYLIVGIVTLVCSIYYFNLFLIRTGLFEFDYYQMDIMQWMFNAILVIMLFIMWPTMPILSALCAPAITILILTSFVQLFTSPPEQEEDSEK
jgi:hypothetical protein